MVVIRSFIEMISRGWSTLSLLKIDSVSWTDIILAFIIVFAIVGSFFRVRR